MRFKVMAYNVLYAFHERQGEAMLRQDDRAQAAREVVRAEAPDVVALSEAVYCGLRGRMIRPDYGAMFGLEHVHASGYEGDWGNCLVSRFPIVQAERVPLGSSPSGTAHSALRATLDVGGREVFVDLVHPSPHIPEAARVEAFRPLLATMRRPYLMLGDFNALSDEDPYDAASLIEQMRPWVKQPEAIAAKMLDRQLVAVVRSHGLRDTLAPADRTHTLPTGLLRPHETQGARLRIDYIFASTEFRVERAAVIKTPATERASDHYPVVATLEF